MYFIIYLINKDETSLLPLKKKKNQLKYKMLFIEKISINI